MRGRSNRRRSMILMEIKRWWGWMSRPWLWRQSAPKVCRISKEMWMKGDWSWWMIVMTNIRHRWGEMNFWNVGRYKMPHQFWRNRDILLRWWRVVVRNKRRHRVKYFRSERGDERPKTRAGWLVGRYGGGYVVNMVVVLMILWHWQ